MPDPSSLLAVSACDLREVFPIASLPDLGQVPPAISDRSVFVSGSDSVTGHRLMDAAKFQSLGSAALAWTPESLRLNGGELCAASYFRLAAIPVSSFPAASREWISDTGVLDLKNLIRLPDGSYAAPLGDYGVSCFVDGLPLAWVCACWRQAAHGS